MNDTPLTQEIIDGGNEGGNVQPVGGSLLAKAAQHPVVTGVAILAGAGLAYAAVKTIQHATDSVAREVHIETSIAIDKSPEELYSFWREFRNLPLFMRNLVSVSQIDDRTSHWVAKGIGGSTVEWNAEIYNEIENELIAWRSLEDSDVVNAGSVRFERGPTGRGTYVRVTMNYNPPAGKIGATVAQMLGAEPGQLIKEDLRRFKQMMETGEIATIDGQTSGRAASTESTVEATASPATENLTETAETVGTQAQRGDAGK